MSLFAVNYTYVADEERLEAVRPEHRAFLGQLADEGVVLLSGPLAPGVGQSDGALIVVVGESAEEIVTLLSDDPFQANQLVEQVEVRGWTPVLGSLLDQVSTRL